MAFWHPHGSACLALSNSEDLSDVLFMDFKENLDWSFHFQAINDEGEEVSSVKSHSSASESKNREESTSGG